MSSECHSLCCEAAILDFQGVQFEEFVRLKHPHVLRE